MLDRVGGVKIPGINSLLLLLHPPFGRGGAAVEGRSSGEGRTGGRPGHGAERRRGAAALVRLWCGWGGKERGDRVGGRG